MFIVSGRKEKEVQPGVAGESHDRYLKEESARIDTRKHQLEKGLTSEEEEQHTGAAESVED